MNCAASLLIGLTHVNWVASSKVIRKQLSCAIRSLAMLHHHHHQLVLQLFPLVMVTVSYNFPRGAWSLVVSSGEGGGRGCGTGSSKPDTEGLKLESCLCTMPSRRNASLQLVVVAVRVSC